MSTTESVTDSGASAPSSGRLSELRALLSRYQLDAYMVPSEDYHDSEYLAACDKRRHFLTGFTGSAGIAVVTKEQALLWTDGRYHLQAARQLDTNWTLMRAGRPEVPRPTDWLASHLPFGAALGVDARQVSNSTYEALGRALEAAGRRLRPVEANLVDLVWCDRPPRPCRPLLVLDEAATGEAVAAKVGRVRERLRAETCYAVALTALDEVAWLLNLRGADIEHNPVFFAFAVVSRRDVHLCIDSNKLTEKVREHLEPVEVKIHDYEDFVPVLQRVVKEAEEFSETAENGAENSNGDSTPAHLRIWVPTQADQGTLECVPTNRRLVKLSPVAVMKAIKNAVEVEQMKAAHLEDAVALCEYLLWLEETVGVDGAEPITEWTAAKHLDGLRAQQPSFISLSFDTISAIGSNGAIIHYKPEEKSARPLCREELYLVDSGGQYMAGTTDVTRTIHLGTPSDEQRQNFTRVLKGVIALHRAVFPTNTPGSAIDCLARLPLWRQGLDYGHGTGHGVGAFLNVHEGPVGISGTRPSTQEQGVREGMMLTIEPGFYKENEYGMRLENVCHVVRAETPHCFNDRQPLTFKAITLVPIQTKMIEPGALDAEEMAWLNDYHAECLERVGPLMRAQGKEKVYKWLQRQTQAIG